MDRAILLRHLASAEDHIAKGAEHIRRQREIVAELERDGHDAALARKLLVEFENMQRLNVTERDRLVKELGGRST
jgi:hypothetical protein